MNERPIKVLLFGDLNLNIIDGSAIWLQSLAQTLSVGSRIRLTILLKSPEERGLITDELRAIPNAEVVSGPELAGITQQLPIPAMRSVLEKLDRERNFDVIVLRGYPMMKDVSRSTQLSGRMWVYLTDIPQTLEKMTAQDEEHINRIISGSRHILCQTEELRSFIEGVFREASPKLVLLPPMIPPVLAAPRARAEARRLVYAGKFAPMWGFLEMVEVFTRLRAQIPGLEFHVLGDKIHTREKPGYAEAVTQALGSTPGLTWHGAVTRARTSEIVASCDIALSYRDVKMDRSLELSTKVLEYGSLGVPVLLNRNPMHERLLGRDYPLFANSIDEAEGVLRAALEDDDRYARASEAALTSSRAYTFPVVFEGLKPYLERAVPPRVAVGDRPVRLLVAGHDMKFFTAIEDHFRALDGVAVTEDRWKGVLAHDENKSTELLAHADVVVCEWCAGNAVWYSHHVHPEQRLVVRFHRFEFDGPYPEEVRFNAVDTMIFVGPRYREQAVGRFGWDPSRSVVIPNWVDTVSLDRPKMAGARFTLGMLGWVPLRKRLDRALDILELLRAADPRFRLVVKGLAPWDYVWVAKRPHERDYFDALGDRIRSAPLLRDAVSFESPGPDVGSWMRKIGWVLSVSDDESFHLAPAEGMASRAVPVLLPWPGAADMYQDRWIHQTVFDAARAIRNGVLEGTWRDEGERARESVGRYAVESVLPTWDKVVLEGSRGFSSDSRR
jgi:glycosyltransferase involved in cell wall biosynthesis